VLKTARLSATEASALRLAAAEGAPALQGALELYRLDRNREELVDTLRRIAQKRLKDVVNELDEEAEKLNG